MTSIFEKLPKAIIDFCIAPLYDNSSASSLRQCSRKLYSIGRNHVWTQPVKLSSFAPSNTSGCPKILRIEHIHQNFNRQIPNRPRRRIRYLRNIYKLNQCSDVRKLQSLFNFRKLIHVIVEIHAFLSFPLSKTITTLEIYLYRNRFRSDEHRWTSIKKNVVESLRTVKHLIIHGFGWCPREIEFVEQFTHLETLEILRPDISGWDLRTHRNININFVSINTSACITVKTVFGKKTVPLVGEWIHELIIDPVGEDWD